MIGPPKRVQSDRGTEFQGAVKVFFKRFGIQYIASRAYHSQAQGKIERSHETSKNKLRYDILNCVEGDMSFLFFVLVRPMKLMTMVMFIFKSFIVRHLYNKKLLPKAVVQDQVLHESS